MDSQALATQVPSFRQSPAEVAAKTGAIYNAMLRDSRYVREPNFTEIHDSDLRRLFDLYDAAFFQGWLRRQIDARPGGRISFRLAPRMHRAGGKMTRFRRQERQGDRVVEKIEFELAVAARLLFLTFGDLERPITIGGIVVPDRLSALQRIVEHEIIHLLEMLAWGESSCSGPRFKALAHGIFGHTDVTHDLVTPAERAMKTLGLRTGDAVEFPYEGATLKGIINRINRRATILVESDSGQLYTSGKRYLKYYVPLGMLRKSG